MRDKKPMGLALLLGKPEKDEKPEPGEDKEEMPEAPLEAAATDLIDAVHAKDVSGVMDALKAAFMFLESTDHEEGSDGE